MLSFSEKVEWYSSVEHRRWKLVYHSIEFSILSIASFVLIVVVNIHGDGSRLQSLLVLFIGLIGLVSAAMAFAVKNSLFKRWHIFAITLGFGCGIGVSTLASLFLLELQI
jgi:Na+-translocating ferredoxin:NAD+ oxidoreductase RnfA subunit